MQYLINTQEPPGDEVRRVLREQCQRVLELLQDWRVDPADRIHRARQTCKRLRALARILKAGAPYVAHVENRFFRDIQKRLAYARDAEALVEALDYLEAGVTDERLKESIGMLRGSLAARAGRGVAEHLPALEGQVRLCCAELEKAARRLERLPLGALKRRDLRRGARRTWERCAGEFAELGLDSPPESFHRWRRHIKYAFYQTQLLAALAPEEAARRESRLRELAQLLGHGQDLELLDDLLQQQADALGIDTHIQRLRRLIAMSLKGLRAQALAAGREIFGSGAEADRAVTNWKQSRKAFATAGTEDAGPRERQPSPHREPDSSSRRQRQ